jgi:SWI/SNF-related matrix-associated actin-dependent regulator 1 of chromatin subfamily A
MIRRLKSEVLKELPDKTYQVVDLPSDGASRAIIRKEKKALGDFSLLDPLTAGSFSEFSKLRKASALAKAPICVEYVKELLDSGLEHVVIFAHHREVISYLLKELDSYNCSSIRGGTALDERNNIVVDFQSGKIRVLVCNIKAAGVGLTLTRASHVIFIEMPWTSADVHQAIDRCHRIGQKNAVLAQFLVIENSFDSLLINAILKKEKISNDIVRNTDEH